MAKTCYVINFYLGDRRKTVEEFSVNDRLYFLKMQIQTLEKYRHSLDKIIFSFNFREDDYRYTSEIFRLVPKYIQGAEVEVHFRSNYGMSYGAWSDAFDRNVDQFDYFIFNEDDYFFIQNNWDSYLRAKFESYTDCGFLCAAIREPDYWNEYKKYAGHSTSIISNEVLKKIKEKYGCLPHAKDNNYNSSETIGQISQSFSALELGYNIYDIRDDYRVAFAWTGDDGRDIWRFFWWNEKDLIIPALLLKENPPHGWYICNDPEFLQEYQPTTAEKALLCHENKIAYYAL